METNIWNKTIIWIFHCFKIEHWVLHLIIVPYSFRAEYAKCWFKIFVYLFYLLIHPSMKTPATFCERHWCFVYRATITNMCSVVLCFRFYQKKKKREIMSTINMLVRDNSSGAFCGSKLKERSYESYLMSVNLLKPWLHILCEDAIDHVCKKKSAFKSKLFSDCFLFNAALNESKISANFVKIMYFLRS